MGPFWLELHLYIIFQYYIGIGHITSQYFIREQKLGWSQLKYTSSQGRGGKGALYVFAAGNGKTVGDNCAADGYINSIYTIAIGSTREDGLSPLYSERCNAVHATTYSGGINEQVKIVSLDVLLWIFYIGADRAKWMRDTKYLKNIT